MQTCLSLKSKHWTVNHISWLCVCPLKSIQKHLHQMKQNTLKTGLIAVTFHNKHHITVPAAMLCDYICRGPAVHYYWTCTWKPIAILHPCFRHFHFYPFHHSHAYIKDLHFCNWGYRNVNINQDHQTSQQKRWSKIHTFTISCSFQHASSLDPNDSLLNRTNRYAGNSPNKTLRNKPCTQQLLQVDHECCRHINLHQFYYETLR